jgi:hypothetical protein
MGLLFKPENRYYWREGSQLICDNWQDEDIETRCPTDNNRWYSSFDYTEEGKIHARLTWNPYFENLNSVIKEVVSNYK